MAAPAPIDIGAQGGRVGLQTVRANHPSHSMKGLVLPTLVVGNLLWCYLIVVALDAAIPLGGADPVLLPACEPVLTVTISIHAVSTSINHSPLDDVEVGLPARWFALLVPAARK